MPNPIRREVRKSERGKEKNQASISQKQFLFVSSTETSDIVFYIYKDKEEMQDYLVVLDCVPKFKRKSAIQGLIGRTEDKFEHEPKHKFALNSFIWVKKPSKQDSELYADNI